MATNNNLTDFLTAVADAIRTKKEYDSTKLINPQDFPAEITSIGADDDNITELYIDQNYTDPSYMAWNEKGNTAISWIINNIHRVLAKKTADGEMTYIRLWDYTSNYYSTDLEDFSPTKETDLTGAQGDVFVKLPTFYYKSEETATDIWKITFAINKPDDTYKTWDGNDLIGAYKGYVENSKLYSRSGVTPNNDHYYNEYKTYVANRGTGFSLVKWKHHCMIAFLYYAWLGHMNANMMIGYGQSSYPQTTGVSNAYGTNYTGGLYYGGDPTFTNLFGLENWINNTYEFLDNVTFNPDSANYVIRITEDDGTTRDIQSSSISGYPSKMLIGENLDLVGLNNSADLRLGYCDSFYTNYTDTNMAVMQAFYSNYANGGVACFNCRSKSTAKASTRLCFRGTLKEVTNIATYEAITAID